MYLKGTHIFIDTFLYFISDINILYFSTYIKKFKYIHKYLILIHIHF